MSSLEHRAREDAGALRRVIVVSCAATNAALACACLTLLGLIELEAVQRVWLVRAAAVAAFAQTALLFAVQCSCLAPIRRHLDAGGAGPAAGRDAAFRAIVALPRRSALAAGCAWGLLAVVFAAGMSSGGRDFGVGPWLATLLGGASAGTSFACLVELALKRAVAAQRNVLAEGFEDLMQRRALVGSLPLRSKLLVAAGAITAATAILAVAATHSRSEGGSFPWGALCGVLGVSTGAGLGLAWLLGGDVARAGQALGVAADRAAAGDLRAVASFDAEDEFGPLCRGFEGVVRSFRQTVERVAQVVARVEGTAGELASFATHAASAAESQLRSVERASGLLQRIDAQRSGLGDANAVLSGALERGRAAAHELGPSALALEEKGARISANAEGAADSIDRIVGTVRASSASAEALTRTSRETGASLSALIASVREADASTAEAVRLSEEAVVASEGGRERVRSGIEGMDAIGEEAAAARAAIGSIADRAGEIGAIAEAIDSVADETNLLALNAAIIAAQTGQRGRAFGLVADEIKDLANRARASTREIVALIRAIKRESDVAVGAVARSGNRVASGVDLAAETGRSLEQIVRAARDSGGYLGVVRAAAHEQVRAAEEAAEQVERAGGVADAIRASSAGPLRAGESVQRELGVLCEEVARVLALMGEHARGAGGIQELAEGASEATGRIETALGEQAEASQTALEALEQIRGATKSGEDAAERLEATTQTLLRQAAELKGDLHRFETWRFR